MKLKNSPVITNEQCHWDEELTKFTASEPFSFCFFLAPFHDLEYYRKGTRRFGLGWKSRKVCRRGQDVEWFASKSLRNWILRDKKERKVRQDVRIRNIRWFLVKSVLFIFHFIHAPRGKVNFVPNVINMMMMCVYIVLMELSMFIASRFAS